MAALRAAVGEAAADVGHHARPGFEALGSTWATVVVESLPVPQASPVVIEAVPSEALRGAHRVADDRVGGSPSHRDRRGAEIAGRAQVDASEAPLPMAAVEAAVGHAGTAFPTAPNWLIRLRPIAVGRRRPARPRSWTRCRRRWRCRWDRGRAVGGVGRPPSGWSTAPLSMPSRLAIWTGGVRVAGRDVPGGGVAAELATPRPALTMSSAWLTRARLSRSLSPLATFWDSWRVVSLVARRRWCRR